MPSQSSSVPTVTRLSLLTTPYWRASTERTSWNSRSMSRVYGVSRRPLGCGTKGRPWYSIVGTTGTTRSGWTSTVPVPSATDVTSL